MLVFITVSSTYQDKTPRFICLLLSVSIYTIKFSAQTVRTIYWNITITDKAILYLCSSSVSKHEDSGWGTLSCSVWTRYSCRHTVKWLNKGHDVDKNMTISQDGCNDTVRFPASHLKLKSTYQEIFQCKVTDGYTKEEHLFTFSPPSSGENMNYYKLQFNNDRSIFNNLWPFFPN